MVAKTIPFLQWKVIFAFELNWNISSEGLLLWLTSRWQPKNKTAASLYPRHPQFICDNSVVSSMFAGGRLESGAVYYVQVLGGRSCSQGKQDWWDEASKRGFALQLQRRNRRKLSNRPYLWGFIRPLDYMSPLSRSNVLTVLLLSSCCWCLNLMNHPSFFFSAHTLP